jgi:tRNA modification GTPase
MAGLRETESLAEAEGVRRARAAIKGADLVLWLMAPENPLLPDATSGPPLWKVGTKSDVGAPPAEVDLSVSAREKSGLDNLKQRLRRFAGEQAGSGPPALLSRERDRVALESALTELDLSLLDTDSLELSAEMLRRVSASLERLVGRMDAEMVLDRLFSSFCIGK